MGSETLPNHVLIVTFAGQGHVNPLLRLAKCLASKGLHVTFSCTNIVGQMIQNSTNTTPDTPINIGHGQLRFQFFSDGWEFGDPRRSNMDLYMHQLETGGRDCFVELIKKQAELGRPVSCIINNPFVPWATDVAADLGIPCAVLWVQSCAVYSIYYHYFHKLASFPTTEQPHLAVDLLGLPTLEEDELPSYLHPLSPASFGWLKNVILQQFGNMHKAFCVLVDSFEELEEEAIKPMLNQCPIRTVGPLFKYKDGDKNNSVRGDLWSAAEECIDWLDSQPPASVVYVACGSIAFLGKDEMEEMARGLLNSGQPFLWVVKTPPKEFTQDGGRVPEGFIEEAKGKGLVVEWCLQDRVLAHPSVACFVTHCGWNSSLEILSSGVPVVTSPHWGDQVTNAKFLTDVYGVGVSLIRGQNDSKRMTRERVEKCIIEVISGPKAAEMKANALKWKKVAEEASAEGGSSLRNLEAFVDDILHFTSKS